MILLRRDSTGTDWKEYKGLLSGIHNAAKNTNLEVGVFSTEPETEMDEIIGLMKIASEIGVSPECVILITPHPTLDVLRMASAEKLSRLLISSKPLVENTNEVLNIIDKIPTTCPLLHFRKSENVPLSVCGAHNDRMVLAPHHMHSWCVTGYEECPHYRMKNNVL